MRVKSPENGELVDEPESRLWFTHALTALWRARPLSLHVGGTFAQQVVDFPAARCAWETRCSVCTK